MQAPIESTCPTLGSVLVALSRAFDLAEGLTEGHAFRTARIALRIGRELRLSVSECESLYYAALLKDSGCSSNAARISEIFARDETLVKHGAKYTDWSSPLASARYVVKHVAFGRSAVEKFRCLAGILGSRSKLMDEVTKARCARGAMVARGLGLGEDTAGAIQALDEHWDGRGAPLHLQKDQIPILARILCLSQTLEVFATAHGAHVGYDIAQERAGRWFEPALVQAALSFETEPRFWADHARHVVGEAIAFEPPASAGATGSANIDTVCRIFSTIIDAKSTYTAQHSTRVAETAGALATYFGFDKETTDNLRRAALLHDIGKLAVPNTILDKAGRLGEQELAAIHRHPKTSFEILSLIPGFERIAEVVSAHNERLDGRGYWRGLSADDLDLEMRILSASDVFDALRSDRSYRAALSVDDALAVMRREVGTGLDGGCVKALSELYGGEAAAPPLPIAA